MQSRFLLIPPNPTLQHASSVIQQHIFLTGANLGGGQK